MIEVKMFQDGDSFYVCFPHCSPELKSIIQGFLKPVMESDSTLVELERENEEPVIPNGNYIIGDYNMAGKKISDVLSTLGYKGYANIRYLLNKNRFSPDDAEKVREILSNYLFDNFYSVNATEFTGNLSEEEVDLFLQCFSDLVTEDMRNNIRNITGFINYDEFLKEGSLDAKGSVICSIIERIQNR